MDSQNFTIRTLAKKAKNRMKEGYWTEVKSVRGNGEAKEVIRKKDQEFFVSLISMEKEEEYYAKVCEILDNDCDLFNPLSKLIDKDYLLNLNDAGDKQRYIFGLAELFILLKRRYMRERNIQ